MSMGTTRDEHLQVCFLALTHNLMPAKVPNRGTKAKPIPGAPTSTQFRAQTGRAKRKTAPNPGARKRETDTKEKASSGQVETT